MPLIFNDEYPHDDFSSQSRERPYILQQPEIFLKTGRPPLPAHFFQDVFQIDMEFCRWSNE